MYVLRNRREILNCERNCENETKSIRKLQWKKVWKFWSFYLYFIICVCLCFPRYGTKELWYRRSINAVTRYRMKMMWCNSQTKISVSAVFRVVSSGAKSLELRAAQVPQRTKGSLLPVTLFLCACAGSPNPVI